jgi:hypothetical protein
MAGRAGLICQCRARCGSRPGSCDERGQGRRAREGTRAALGNRLCEHHSGADAQRVRALSTPAGPLRPRMKRRRGQAPKRTSLGRARQRARPPRREGRREGPTEERASCSLRGKKRAKALSANSATGTMRQQTGSTRWPLGRPLWAAGCVLSKAWLARLRALALFRAVTAPASGPSCDSLCDSADSTPSQSTQISRWRADARHGQMSARVLARGFSAGARLHNSTKKLCRVPARGDQLYLARTLFEV